LPRVALVTALLPPSVGGTEILIWRLFRDHRDLVVVSGGAFTPEGDPDSRDDGYRALDATTLRLPYPTLRGYRYGLAPLLGALATGWLAKSLPRLIGFLRETHVERVVSVPHQGPFALLGYLAARALGLEHTFYILDAWEEGATGPIERTLIGAGLRRAARAPRSRLAVVSPALGAHYRARFGFPAPIWIPNPAPLPDELPSMSAVPQPDLLFTGGIKPFNIEALRRVARAIKRCLVTRRLIVTGKTDHLAAVLRAHGELHDRVEFRRGTRVEIARLQREAAVLLVATNADDGSETARGYLPGRLPEYVSSGRPIILVGRQDSDAARAVRHWKLGRTTASTDEGELAAIIDVSTRESSDGDGRNHQRDLFLEVFSRAEARRRLLGEPAPPLSRAAAELADAFANRSA
jgi:hypothetical protein